MPEEDKDKETKLQFLTCPRCQGQGVIDNKTCPECQGVGSVAWTGQQLLYWGKKIDIWHLAKKKTENLVKNIINFSLLVFGVLGLLALAQVIFVMVGNNLPFWKFYNFRNWQLFVFWLSLVTDSYLFYRLQRDVEKIKYIPKRKYDDTPLIFQVIDWNKIKDLKKEEKIDVGEYFTPEALLVIEKAWKITNKYQQPEINPVNLLISLLTFEKINIIFSRLGISFQSLKSKIA